MKMSNYKNPQVMSSSGMDNQDALSLAVRLYGHFLHNLVEEGFEGVENGSAFRNGKECLPGKKAVGRRSFLSVVWN